MPAATLVRRGRGSRQSATLSEVVAYRNARVIRGFLRDYDLPPAEARMLFREMLKLLWLSEKYDRKIPIWAAWKPLDDMWHWFVLHTEDYEQFCQRYFGHMLHHDPETRGSSMNRRFAAALPVDHDCLCKEYEREVHRCLEIVWTELGRRTANRWFNEFWHRYTPEFLDAHYRRPSSLADADTVAILASRRRLTGA
jgi:uncharacterized protein YeaO (DUF488 family)